MSASNVDPKLFVPSVCEAERRYWLRCLAERKENHVFLPFSLSPLPNSVAAYEIKGATVPTTINCIFPPDREDLIERLSITQIHWVMSVRRKSWHLRSHWGPRWDPWHACDGTWWCQWWLLGHDPPATTHSTVKFRRVNMILLEEKTDKRCSKEDYRLFRCT